MPFWQRSSVMHGNIPLLAVVLLLGILICGLQFLNLAPRSGLEARPAAVASVSNTVVAVRQMESVYERASAVYQKGSVDEAIHLLSSSPLVDKGSPAPGFDCFSPGCTSNRETWSSHCARWRWSIFPRPISIKRWPYSK